MSQALTYNDEKDTALPSRILQKWNRQQAEKDNCVVSTVHCWNRKSGSLSQSSGAKERRLLRTKGKKITGGK